VLYVVVGRKWGVAVVEFRLEKETHHVSCVLHARIGILGSRLLSRIDTGRLHLSASGSQLRDCRVSEDQKERKEQR
jgi:hypothetical protein